LIVERVGDDPATLFAMENIDEIVNEIVKETEGGKVTVNIRRSGDGESIPGSPYFGIYVEDVTFPKAQALSYTQNYGIVVTGVVQGSPAWEHRLLEDDIIMMINDVKILHNKVFDKVRSGLRAGDQIKIQVFRNGKIENVDMIVGARGQRGSTGIATSTEPSKKKLSPGYGGGTWIPMYFKTDMADVNELLSRMGFDEQPKDGIIMYGGGGKLPVGKGFFIGGYGVTYEDTQKKGFTDALGNGTQWLRYTNTMGGVTLDKRIPLSSKLITSAGFMLGGGMHSMEVTKTHGDYDWNDLHTDADFVNYTLERGYIVVQPRAEIMYRLLSWLAIRAEAGYTYGYSPTSRWQIKGFSGENFNVVNSPKTEYQGLNVSIGPWFGF
ncbi:MAG: PDZ domain-containing protein, partial [Candidatus Cloacimonadaceae bacterium]|nr:PDZ domain-containing protein [Candidatus Cloacimonadaceae bacterium]